MYILLKDVQFQVIAGSELSEPILTNIREPQGDCLSALLFTFYLAKSLEDKESALLFTFYLTKSLEDKDYEYDTPNEKIHQLPVKPSLPTYRTTST